MTEQNNKQQVDQQEKEFIPQDIIEIIVTAMCWIGFFTFNPLWFFIGIVIGMGRAYLLTGDYTCSKAGNTCAGGAIIYFIIVLLFF